MREANQRGVLDTDAFAMFEGAMAVAELQVRYEAALVAAGLDAVVIHAGSLRKRSEFDDQYWPLRPVPHFQHWAPLAQTDCAIVVEAGKKPRLAWLKAFDFWEEPCTPETDHFVGSFDVVEIEMAVLDLLAWEGPPTVRRAPVWTVPG